MLLRAQFGFQNIEHCRADVDAGDVGAQCQGVHEKPAGADADFQHFAVGLPDFIQVKFIVHAVAGVVIDHIIKAGELCRVFVGHY